MESEARQNITAKRKNISNKLGILQADYKAEDDKRKKLEEEVSKARSRCGGMFAQAKENEEIQKKLNTLENRLDVAYSSYNKYLKKLEQLRTQIDELRKERFTFRNIYSKAIQNEKEKEEQISGLIAQSNESYALRDQLKLEVVEMKNADKEHQQKYEQEIERFTNMIEGQEILNQHPRTQNQVPSLMSQTASSLEAVNALQTETDSISNKIEKTLKLTKSDDLHSLFEKIDQLEQENYSLFNLVVELGADKTKLLEKIDQLNSQNNDLAFNESEMDSNQNNQLEKLTEIMKETENRMKELTEVKEQNDKEIKEVYKNIGKLFEIVGCKWDGSPDGKDVVTPSNALYCISKIEKVFSQLMSQVSERASCIPITKEETKLMDSSMRSTSKLPVISRLNDPMLSKVTLNESKPMTPDEIRQKLGL